ncbi:MAG: hypothetical protein IPM46_12615 [Flavobacteriales bacterium]|nr:hypothetical protein [Flavobacteriales bacterium]
MQRRTWIAIIIVAIIFGGGYAWKEYNRVPTGAASMDAAFSTTAEALHADFLADEAAATAKYVGAKEQAIRVEGVIRAVEQADGGGATVILETADAMAGVLCEFASDALPKDWKSGDQVTVQGICTGMNDLIPDVIMVRCAAVE